MDEKRKTIPTVTVSLPPSSAFEAAYYVEDDENNGENYRQHRHEHHRKSQFFYLISSVKRHGRVLNDTPQRDRSHYFHKVFVPERRSQPAALESIFRFFGSFCRFRKFFFGLRYRLLGQVFRGNYRDGVDNRDNSEYRAARRERAAVVPRRLEAVDNVAEQQRERHTRYKRRNLLVRRENTAFILVHRLHKTVGFWRVGYVIESEAYQHQRGENYRFRRRGRGKERRDVQQRERRFVDKVQYRHVTFYIATQQHRKYLKAAPEADERSQHPGQRVGNTYRRRKIRKISARNRYRHEVFQRRFDNIQNSVSFSVVAGFRFSRRVVHNL